VEDGPAVGHGRKDTVDENGVHVWS
jgi:hypothetical protein